MKKLFELMMVGSMALMACSGETNPQNSVMEDSSETPNITTQEPIALDTTTQEPVILDTTTREPIALDTTIQEIAVPDTAAAVMYKYESSFDTDGCKRSSFDALAKAAPAKNYYALADESPIAMEQELPIINLIQNGDSYQVVIPDAKEDCGFSSSIAVTTIERQGNLLTISVQDTSSLKADCGFCYYDLKINIKPEDANAQFIYFRGTSYKVVRKHSEE